MPVGILCVENLAEAALLKVFIIAFPATLFGSRVGSKFGSEKGTVVGSKLGSIIVSKLVS